MKKILTAFVISTVFSTAALAETLYEQTTQSTTPVHPAAAVTIQPAVQTTAQNSEQLENPETAVPNVITKVEKTTTSINNSANNINNTMKVIKGLKF